MTREAKTIPGYPHNRDRRKRRGLCRQCGNTANFICFKCRFLKQYYQYDKGEQNDKRKSKRDNKLSQNSCR